MSEVDAYDVTDEESPRSMRSALRRQARENGRLRAQLAARDNAEPAAPEAADGPAEEQPDPAARLAEAQAAAAEAEAQYEALTRVPVGISPEDIAAHKLTEQAMAQAIHGPDGLDGMYQRLQDRSVSWPQLQQELRAFGWRDPAEATGWD